MLSLDSGARNQSLRSGPLESNCSLRAPGEREQDAGEWSGDFVVAGSSFPGGVGRAQVQPLGAAAGMERERHRPDPISRGNRRVGGHRMLDAEGHGDVLGVHEDVGERVFRLGAGRVMSHPGHVAEVRDELGYGSRRPSAGVAGDVSVEAPPRPRESDEGSERASAGRQRDVRSDVTHLPPVAERLRLPLLRGEALEEVGQGEPLGLDRLPQQLAFHGVLRRVVVRYRTEDTPVPEYPPKVVRVPRPDADLPTTSYAVLGMLAIGSWTGYELTQQMRRSLDYCWPKADSVLYEEPRRLVAAGLARATAESEEGRSRTRYHITAKGRRALRAWLATTPAAPRLEVEPLLRLLYADHGSPDDLRRAVAAFREWGEARYEGGIAMFRDYLATGGPFPDRLHLQVLFGGFYEELFFLVRRWADMVDAEIDAWPDTAGVGWTATTRALSERAVERYESRPTRLP